MKRAGAALVRTITSGNWGRNPPLTRSRLSAWKYVFLSKIKGKIDDIQNLLHENLVSQLMNPNDYYVNLRWIMFISSCFEMSDKLIWPLLEYMLWFISVLKLYPDNSITVIIILSTLLRFCIVIVKQIKLIVVVVVEIATSCYHTDSFFLIRPWQVKC